MPPTPVALHMPPVKIEAEKTALLVVDLQERMMPGIDRAADLLTRAEILIRGAKILGVPIWATEQYPDGLGPTVKPIREAMGGGTEILAKTQFSALIEPVVRQLGESGIRTVLLCGVETHVCILQSALDLASNGCVPVTIADAVGSRRLEDGQVALERLGRVGLISSVESVLLEMVGDAAEEHFKAILPLIK